MRTLFTTWLFTFLLAASSASADDLVDKISAANKTNKRGQHRRAAEMYKALLPEAKIASAPVRASIQQGMLSACRALAATDKADPAIDCLITLVVATKPAADHEPISGLVRRELEHLAFDMVMSGRSDRAVRALSTLMADGPASPLRWALLARAHLDRGELERATQTLRRGLSAHPGSPELLFVRAALAGNLSEQAVARANYASAENMLRRSVADLEKALGRERDAPGIHRALGKIRAALWVYYRATGRYGKAIQMLMAAEDAYERSARIDPHNPDVVLDLANLLYTAQDWVWAEQVYARAKTRYRVLLKRPDLSATLAKFTRQHLAHCDEQIAHSLEQRALSAARRGHFARAVGLVRQMAAEHPPAQERARRLESRLIGADRAHTKRIRKLQGQPDSAAAQMELGDVWLQAGKWKAAEQAYRLALDLSPKAEQDRARQRLHGVAGLPGTSETHRIRIGELTVSLEIPAGSDASTLRGDLEKAHALTMAVFSHRLVGPLEIKVFANKRMFLERAGVAVEPNQQGLYAFGRVLTYNWPGRSRAIWLDILVHEMSHRYIDEMTYHNAPRWLSEGLAQWAARGWPHERKDAFAQLSDAGRLPSWPELELIFAQRWTDGPALSAAYLQSHQLVAWLFRRFGGQRVMTLLAGLRQGRGMNESARLAFGLPLDQLQNKWAAEFR